MNPLHRRASSPPFHRLGLLVVWTGVIGVALACGSSGTGGGHETLSSPKVYGSGFNADDLGNITVGYASNDACNRQYSLRFRATQDGALKSIRPFFIWNYTRSGYHSGNGGIIQVQVQADDGSSNHQPSGTVLGSLTVVHPVNDVQGFYPLLTFPTPPTLVTGQIFHLVFTNVDPDPATNWVSLDCAWIWYATAPLQPTVPDTDLAILERCPGGAWKPYRRGDSSATPCIELDYADGTAQGQGYIEFYSQNPKVISGTQGVRETFTVSGPDRIVTAAALRVKYISGPSPLTLRLEKADGTLTDEGKVIQVPVTPGPNGASWARVQFAAPRTLASGQTYHLVAMTPADTVFQTQGIRKGIDKGFKAPTVFTDGIAQFNDGRGWTGWDSWGQTNRQDVDLQFYFETK